MSGAADGDYMKAERRNGIGKLAKRPPRRHSLKSLTGVNYNTKNFIFYKVSQSDLLAPFSLPEKPTREKD